MRTHACPPPPHTLAEVAERTFGGRDKQWRLVGCSLGGNLAESTKFDLVGLAVLTVTRVAGAKVRVKVELMVEGESMRS